MFEHVKKGQKYIVDYNEDQYKCQNLKFRFTVSYKKCGIIMCWIIQQEWSVLMQ